VSVNWGNAIGRLAHMNDVNPNDKPWYETVNNNGYGGEGNSNFQLGANNLGDYQDGKNNWSGSIEDLTHAVGGVRYLDADRTTAIDANGTTYQRTGNNQWSMYNSSQGTTQSSYDRSGIGVFGAHVAGWDNTGWGSGHDFGTNMGEVEGQGYNTRRSAAFDVFNRQTAARLDTSKAPITAASQASPAAATVVSSPVNHDFIAGLQQQLAGNTSAGLESAQAQGTANANQMRLAAGANTLSGNFAAAGAAGQSALSSEQQGDVAQANAVQSQAQQQNVSTLGKALQQQVSTDLASKSANLDQTMQNIADVTDSLRQDIGQATTQQGQQIKAYLDQLAALQQQYQNISGNDAQAAQQRAQIAQTILSVAGTAAAIAA
jgi:hypothetical protein